MSAARTATVNLIERSGVVAIIRMKDGSKLPRVVDALIEGGVRTLEITMTVPGAVELIRQIAPTLPADFRLGAGTVTDAKTVDLVVDAGATFVVSPVFRREVLAACQRRDVPTMPGCFSPTEILDAWEAGADVVKVFPATALGPGFFKDVRAPLPHVKMMPTGGVTLDNAGTWIAAGAVAVGVGTALVDAKTVDAGDFAEITERAKRIVANVQAARGNK
jgi:2-dehydro-3-deoxyphosphogluconate aldolase/(4S)-4-hydroxy-2-oxoglutarate aldolase